MTPLVQNYADLLAQITLAKGGHPDRSNGLCVMEAAAYVAGGSVHHGSLVCWREQECNGGNR